MKNVIQNRAAEYKQAHRRKRRWQKLVTGMAAVVVFCTTYALILPAITMENTQEESMEHIHTEDCYTQVTSSTRAVLACSYETLGVHTHTEDCYDEQGALVCGYADFVVHTHDASCYDENGNLLCALPEIEAHTHTESCYEAVYTEADTEEIGSDTTETEDTGSDTANTENIRSESTNTEHTDSTLNISDSYEETASHVHTEDCYTLVQGELTCTIPESEGHSHTEDCYTESTSLICTLPEDETHQHNEDCYETTMELTCQQEEASGHSHTEDCYAWEQVLTCEASEASEPVASEPIETEQVHTAAQVLTCGKEEILLHTHTESCYDENGALICGLNEIQEHVHTSECFRMVEEPVDTEALTCQLAEDETHTHTALCYGTWELTCGLEETVYEETEAPSFTYEDESLLVTVTLPEDTEIPEKARLIVRPITGETENYAYDELTYQAEEALLSQTEDLLFYEIGFYTAEEEYIPVSDTAVVCFQFKDNLSMQPGDSIAVLHYEETDALPVMLEDVEVSLDENETLSEITFKTQGFSVFAVATLSEDGTAAQADGESSFSLTYGGYTITFNIVDEDENAIAGDYTSYNITAEAATKYVFGAAGETDSNESNVVYGIAPSIDGYTYVGAKYGNFTVYSVSTAGYADGSDSVNPNTFRFYENEPIVSGDWYSRSENCTVTLTYQLLSPDYTGDWAIVNNKNGGSSGIAMLASGLSDDNSNRAAATVNLITIDNKQVILDNTVTVWHFEKQENGTYHISTLVDNVTKYLTIGSSQGSPVTLSDNPQEITVTKGSETHAGMYRLTNSSGLAVNLFGGSANQGFGTWSDSKNNEWQSLYEVFDTSEGYLYYDINVPSLASKGTDWGKQPTIASPIQSLDGATNLFGQPDGYYTEAGTAGIANLYRFNVTVIDGLGDSTAWEEGFGKTWYGEERFDGWTCSIEGTTYLLDPGAAFTHNNENGTLTVTASKTVTTDANGTESIVAIDEKTITLPTGTTLTGKWTEVSNVVTFFINYKGTILDVEGDVSGRRQDTFTKTAALGHIFYGKQKTGTDSVFATAANAAITAAFQPAFDPDNPDTQIVIEYLRTCESVEESGKVYTTDMDLPAKGANSNEVAANTLKLLKDTGRTIQVSTADGNNNPVIDNELCDPDHYQVRWYVMKEQTDTWHIDGVLVAKTSEIAVTKTFTGLDNDTVSNILNNTDSASFSMPVKLGKDQRDYLSMTATPIDGESQYEYNGQQSNIHSYHWTLHAITDETYTLSEENYEVAGYDVSSIIVHYYTDKSGASHIEYTYGDSTKDFLGEEATDPVVKGGYTTAVSFNNLYTPSDTGALAVVKRDSSTTETDLFGKLEGAEFTLYTDEECINTAKDASNNKQLIASSNANGTAYFNNLAEGTYYLKETKAPDGYKQNDGIWKIVVTKSDTNENSSTVKVTVYEKSTDNSNDNNTLVFDEEHGTTVYDGGITGSYTVKDEPNHTTITVTKTFTGLTLEELNGIVQNSTTNSDGYNPDGYYIKFQGAVGGSGSGEIDAENNTQVTLTLDQAQRSQDQRTFTWTIHNLAVDDVTYTITEYNYLLDAYADTVVTAKISNPTNGELIAVSEEGDSESPQENEVQLIINREDKTAELNKVKFSSDINDIVELTNHYTNTFTLTLQKVDKTGTPLPKAVFDVYGPYADAKDTGKSITYTDPATKRTRTAYFIETITANEDGIAVKEGLQLSGTNSTFVYVINESFAPDGYAKLDEPIVSYVTVNSDNYASGVYTSDVVNYKEEEYVHPALTALKEWEPQTPNPADNVTVTLELYRVTHTERNAKLKEVVEAKKIAAVTLDGITDDPPDDPPTSDSASETENDTDATVQTAEISAAYESAPWTATWTNIPSANEDSYDNADATEEHYHYFIREITQISGYKTTYICTDTDGKVLNDDDALQKLRITDDDGDSETIITAYLIADMDDRYTVTVTNTAYYELPETGETGTSPFYLLGVLLMLAASLLGLRIKKNEKGDLI